MVLGLLGFFLVCLFIACVIGGFLGLLRSAPTVLGLMVGFSTFIGVAVVYGAGTGVLVAAVVAWVATAVFRPWSRAIAKAERDAQVAKAAEAMRIQQEAKERIVSPQE